LRPRSRGSASFGTGLSRPGSDGRTAGMLGGWEAINKGHRTKGGGLAHYGFAVCSDVPWLKAEDLPYRKRGSMDKVNTPSRHKLAEKEETSAR
jgi:hypothetical protein